MKRFILVTSLLAVLLAGCVLPNHPRACAPGTEFWKLFKFQASEPDTWVLADITYWGLDNPDLTPYVTFQGCRDGSIVKETIKQAQVSKAKLLFAIGGTVFDLNAK